jgi:alpha-beta hydrolase superfamily lysophospholipase
MSDSPYSLRTIGERLHRDGAHVLGLRLPGHGTAPSGLLEFTRKDMDAAVKIAVRHLRERLGDRPVYLVGYSNGGALAVHYGLEMIEDESLPKVSGIVLLSPAIGVTPMAAFAVWQGRIGHWLGLEKLAWTSIAAEYDPYKYNSFAVNAGDQVYRLTVEIGKHLDRLAGTGKLDHFPPLLAFQSAVDATVSTPALIAGLFSKLPGDQHELVLFDLNRVGQIESFVTNDPRKHLSDLIRSAQKPFALTVLRNRDSTSLALEERHFERTDLTPEVRDPGLTWPPGVYSLSHVAIPFSPDDPVYGNGLSPDHQGATFQIGNIVLRGEKSVIQISPVDQLRLRWNPFYPWLEERVARFVGDGE